MVAALAEMLRAAFGAGHAVREEKPLQLADSLPEPDVAVVRGVQRDYVARHPGAADAVLVVEVAVTSQAFDHDKARIYARAGEAVLWLVDLPARRLEVHTDPQADGRYRVVQVLADGDEVAVPATCRRLAVGTLFA
jgi:Uma2 family endonuclease